MYLHNRFYYIIYNFRPPWVLPLLCDVRRLHHGGGDDEFVPSSQAGTQTLNYDLSGMQDKYRKRERRKLN